MRLALLVLLLFASCSGPQFRCADGADAILDAAPDPAGGVHLSALCGALVVGAQTCARWAVRPQQDGCWLVDCDGKALWRLCGASP